ncbi:transmembrane protein 53-A isoform X2 [Takifugu flavidus]|uniref:Uncharacterized protein n=2 Tax=Takifugu flavidus TaxID=433684 RepID=A0A5C6P9E3_9TELE|nr:transmembrane protein 53-A isoform X2 [Takifugu flavidus]TWW76414.1 hypothetical protein D4764_13G0010760 [Takifugu flavidus]
MLCRTVQSIGVNAHRLSKNVTLYLTEASPVPVLQNETSQNHKPLMLMLPWLGSRPQTVDKYCQIYFRTGFDVLVVESEVQDFLWPRWGLDRGKSLLDLLHTERFISRPLIIHAFSIGAFTFAQLLVHVAQDTQKYQPLIQRIKGQVYDSMVVGTLETMAAGLGKTLFPNLETLVKHASLTYFSLFKSQTVDHFEKGIDVFWNTPVTAPVLLFFCENDLMSNAQMTEELISHWRKRGMDVTAKKWEDSTHASHLKRHPQEYLSHVDRFLCSLQLSPLKAKL